MLKYTEEKIFTQEQVQQLFLSVHWISGNYPARLYKALMNSSTVLTVWDDEKMVGLTRVLDDTAMLARYIMFLFIRIIRDRELLVK